MGCCWPEPERKRLVKTSGAGTSAPTPRVAAPTPRVAAPTPRVAAPTPAPTELEDNSYVNTPVISSALPPEKTRENKNLTLKRGEFKVCTNPWTTNPADSKVHATRLCPTCFTTFKAVHYTEEAWGCKNGQCSCLQWWCLRCMKKVKNIADHSTCCILSHVHNNSDCQCKEAGLQQLTDTNTITYVEDARIKY